MPTRPLGSDTVVRIRAELVRDPKDNSLYRDWENATELTIPDCSVQAPKLSDKLRNEIDNEREYQLTFVRLYAPPGTDLRYTDRLIFGNDLYEIQGEPTPWRRFNGQEHHVTALLKLREG